MEWNTNARSMCKQLVQTSSKCGNTKSPRKFEKAKIAISFWTIWCSLHWKHRKERFVNHTRWERLLSSPSWVQTKQREEQVFINFVATPRRQHPKVSWQDMLKIPLWLQRSQRKEQLCIILVATHKSSTRKIKGAWMSQRKTKALTCLHANQRKEQLFTEFLIKAFLSHPSDGNNHFAAQWELQLFRWPLILDSKEPCNLTVIALWFAQVAIATNLLLGSSDLFMPHGGHNVYHWIR